MAKLIKIDKIKKENFVHYYRVSTLDFKTSAFYVGIDENNNLIYIFLNNDFSKPFRIIDSQKKDEKIIIPEIHPYLMWPAIRQALKALNKKKFPFRLDYSV